MRLRFALLPLLGGLLASSASLSDDDRKLLQDTGGWEYVSLSENQNGFPLTHTCFDGDPHPDECSGTLTLSSSGRFTQVTKIRGQSVQRGGHYDLNGDQLAFFDEFEHRDGPYTLTLNKDDKTLKMVMAQVTVELMLTSEYKARLKGKAH